MKKRWMAMLLCVTMLFSLMAPSALAAEGGIVIENGDFTAEKISNPTAGEGEPDGLQDPATRMSSYAWCMARMTDEYGDYVYIGTNCDMLYAAVDMGLVGNLDKELAAKIVKAISNDEIYTDCSTPDFAKALILRYNVRDEKIEPWFDPQNYPLFDAEGNTILKNLDFAYVSAFRVAQNFKGQLYINATVLYPQPDGSTVEHTEIYRLNSNSEKDRTPEVVWRDDGGTLLRAMTVSQDGQTMYFGGIKTVDGKPQIKIYETTTGEFNSFNPVADGTESVFLRYENDEIPKGTDINKYYKTYWTFGGNVWDLIEYQGELYMTLMTNYGGMIFKAHKDSGNESANGYDWVWTEFVGDATEAVGYGAGFDNRANYSFSPFIYKGNLYFLGFTSAFDPVTVSTMSLLSYLYPAEGETRSINGFLDSLYPMERSLDNECSIFRMTQDGKMQMVMGDKDKCPEGFDYVATVGAGFNDADYSTTLYSWRAAEYNGKLYIGTFDSYTLFKMFTKLTNGDLLNMNSEEFHDQLEYVKELLESILTDKTAENEDTGSVTTIAGAYRNAVNRYINKLADKALEDLFDELAYLQKHLDEKATTTFLSWELERIALTVERLDTLYKNLDYLYNATKWMPITSTAIKTMMWRISTLKAMFGNVDAEGLRRYIRISNTLAANENPGFELYCTEDGVNYEPVTLDGFHDEFNYGCRTLLATDDGLMLGTANPFYGAQLWKITDGDEQDPRPEPPAPIYSGGGSVTTYTITCGEGVTANKKTAAANATVTLTVEDGYAAPVVKDEDGKIIEVTEKDGKYTFKMPASAVTVSVLCPRDETCPIEAFADTKNDFWWHDGIHYCVDNELMNGFPDGTFQPNGFTTRAQIVVMLWRMAGSPVVNYAHPFADVEDGYWFTEAIRWAAAEEIVKGVSETEFAPNAPVTREQLAAMLYRYAQYKGHGFNGAWAFLLDFSDRENVSDWAYEAVCWCSMKGIVTGRTETEFVPGDNATRAEVAAMFQRFCQTVLGK